MQYLVPEGGPPRAPLSKNTVPRSTRASFERDLDNSTFTSTKLRHAWLMGSI